MHLSTSYQIVMDGMKSKPRVGITAINGTLRWSDLAVSAPAMYGAERPRVRVFVYETHWCNRGRRDEINERGKYSPLRLKWRVCTRVKAKRRRNASVVPNSNRKEFSSLSVASAFNSYCNNVYKTTQAHVVDAGEIEGVTATTNKGLCVQYLASGGSV